MEAPLDTWHALVGVAVASVVVFATAASLPTRPPPDAAGVADTVDGVAVADAAASATHPVAADRIRLGPDRIALRNDAGTARARFAYGPVVPVRAGPPPNGSASGSGTAPVDADADTGVRGDADADTDAGARPGRSRPGTGASTAREGRPALASVLYGVHPATAYESPAAFRAATELARNRTATWRSAPDAVAVRRVSWEGVDVTLVGPAR
jgi:hypothetical protein